MDHTGILSEETTGLHVGWYFWLRVLDEVNRSARYGAPFALLLLEAVGQKDVPRRAIDEATARIASAIRGTDIAGYLGVGRAGVLLIEQDEPGAQRASQRILESMRGNGRLHWDTRLLVHPRDAAEISNLLTVGATERPAPRERAG